MAAVLHLDGGQWEYLRLDLDGLTVDDDTPVLEGLLPEEIIREVLDGLELLHRVLPCGSKDIPHPSRVLSDGLRDTINVAELRRDMALLPIDLHHEEGLLGVGDLEVVALDEVLGNADLLAISSHEPRGDGGLLEVDVLNKVGLLEAVVADDSLPLELEANAVIDFARVMELGSDLMDTGQAGLVRDELVDAVDHNRQPGGVVVGGCSEPGASLEARALNIDGLGHVEEARLLSNLPEIGLPEGLLHDDVEQGVHDGVILHLRLSDVLPTDVLFRSSIDDDCVLDVTELDIHRDSLIKVCGGEDIAT